MGSPWRSRAAHGIQGVEGGVSRVKLQICTSWTEVTLTNIQLLCFDGLITISCPNRQQTQQVQEHPLPCPSFSAKFTAALDTEV